MLRIHIHRSIYVIYCFLENFTKVYNTLMAICLRLKECQCEGYCQIVMVQKEIPPHTPLDYHSEITIILISSKKFIPVPPAQFIL